MDPEKATRGSVLVVDNDRHSLVAARAVLEPLGCRVVLVRSGQEAVERTGGEDFAAIVMDVCMPALDGYAAGSFIRQNPRTVRTPILFVSGEDIDLSSLTRQFGSVGLVDCMRKPLDPDLFVAKISGFIDAFMASQRLRERELAATSARAEAPTKDDLLAMVAHDLNGPLTALRTHTELLRRRARNDVPDPTFVPCVNRHLDLVDRTVDRMAKIVGDLLDTARIDAGTLRLDLAPHDLVETIEQTIELLRPLAEKKNIALELLRPEGACVVSCDRDRILQILSNLVGNALKFAPGSTKVEIDVVLRGFEWVVGIRDSGPGIATEELSLVFEKFWQGARKGSRQGVGLGLAIARAIVLAHGGRIWVESRVGEGSRFLFSVPCAKPAVDACQGPDSGPRAKDIPPSSGDGTAVACRSR